MRLYPKYFLFPLTLLGLLYSPYILPLHVLHLSFHKGCLHEIEMIAQQLNFTVTSLFIPNLVSGEFDGISSGNALYNVGHERAQNIWNKHKDYFNQFDAIITSDTAPLARIFLQNNYTKPLIIWICNRFDYSDQSSLDCDFPDEEYYQLMRDACTNDNVFLIPNCKFEALYASKKNVYFNCETIQPIAAFNPQDKTPIIPLSIDKAQTFFIPQYLNDSSMNLIQECTNLNIMTHTYSANYRGPSDLRDFKGIIHIPYAWSTIAFFANIQQGLPYFIPSSRFMCELYDKGQIWWQNGNLFKENFHVSEWYSKENSEIISYFDSWDDLKQKIESTDFNALRIKIKQYAEKKAQTTLEKWHKIFDKIQLTRNRY